MTSRARSDGLDPYRRLFDVEAALQITLGLARV
jgi:hypothetical protein